MLGFINDIFIIFVSCKKGCRMNTTIRKILRITGKTLLWLAGIWLALLVILEIALSEKVLTKIVNRYAKEYVDGDIHFGKASISMFRRFPAAVLTLEDLAVTYPAERFDSLERAGVQGHLMYHGCSDQADTLASLHRFSVGLNVPALIGGTVRVPYMRLDRPRIFAHAYNDGSANWNMFKLGEESVEDTTETAFELPKIVIGKVKMTGRPHIVYTDCRDSIFALVSLRNLELNGRINNRRMSPGRIGLSLDTLFVAGRISRDTLALGIDRLYLHEAGRKVNVDMVSKAFVATREYGRIGIPLNISGLVSFPKDSVLAVKVEDLQIGIADIPITGEADLRFRSGATDVKADISTDRCDLNNLIRRYATNFVPLAKGIDTDAVLNIQVHCDGEYIHSTGQLPSTLAEIEIPDAVISHSDFGEHKLKLGLRTEAEIDRRGRIDIDVKRLYANVAGVELDTKAGVRDLLAQDPYIDIDGGVYANLDSIASLLPDSLQVDASGALVAMVKGSARLSQLSLYNFSSSSLTGNLIGEKISVNMPADTISAVIDGLDLTLGPEKRASRRDSTRTISTVGISGNIAKADVSYKGQIWLNAYETSISAKNFTDTQIRTDDSTSISPFRGQVNIKKLSLKDSGGSALRLSNTANSFSIFPKRGQSQAPVLALTSRNEKIMLKYDATRGLLNNANLRMTAAMNTFEKRQKMKAYRDSLAKIYPYIPMDSLMRHHMKVAGIRRSTAVVEDEFKEHDIDISLDRTLAKYFREWDLSGKMTVGQSFLMTPRFPLRNTLKGFDLNITNDKIEIAELGITSGESTLSATGELTGLRRALLGRKGALKLKLDILSEKMNADQLLTAYSNGQAYSKTSEDVSDELSEEVFIEEEEVELDSVAVTSSPSLIVVPKNLNADISFFAGDINYQDLHIDIMTADLIMKDRCVQIANTQALTNMGGINFEGFYSTRSKDDLKTGFSINFKDITAEKVINLMPSVDTLMPLLKSFGGNLNCELAATASLDEEMNLMMPSINGILRISGNDLYIKNNDMFKKMARLLIFKNRKEGHIDKMTVEGVIKDSKVEVFPFILEMDRYMLGLSGVQNMDMSFRYHASLIKSPFLIKLGMDIYGPDFDNMKFKIGKAKYKSRNVPVFSSVIDMTKVNLVESIRNVFDKGVDAVMKDGSAYNAIEQHKKNIGYVQAVDQKMEELSADEQKQFEAEQQAQEQEEQQVQETTEQNAE